MFTPTLIIGHLCERVPPISPSSSRSCYDGISGEMTNGFTNSGVNKENDVESQSNVSIEVTLDYL